MEKPKYSTTKPNSHIIFPRIQPFKDNNYGGVIFWELAGDAPLKGSSLTDVIYKGFFGDGGILCLFSAFFVLIIMCQEEFIFWSSLFGVL